MTEVCNIMAFIRSLADADCNLSNPIELVILLLTNFLREDEENIELHALISFITEQLKLCVTEKHARRYSKELIVTAFLWHMTSNSLYKKLGDIQLVFFLPTVRRLQQLSSGTSVEQSSIDHHYLQNRISCLTETEKIMVLMIDEVYTTQRIEYRNGKFIGLTEDGKPAKTGLTFMISSIASKFKDVIQLVPVDGLTTKQLRKHFDTVDAETC